MRLRLALFPILLTLARGITAQPIQIAIVPPAELGEDQTAEWRILIRNTTEEERRGELLPLLFDSLTLVRLSPVVCPADSTDQALHCPLPPLAPQSTLDVVAEMRAPFRYGRVTGLATVNRLDTFPIGT